MAVQPIPEHYEGVTPYLIIDQASAAIDFYRAAFDAKEVMRLDGPDGTVGHAELKIGGGIIMLSEEHPAAGWRGPLAYGGSPVALMVYVQDVDATFDRAIKHGAREVRPVQDQFYGDRSGTLTDPFGHVWTVATHIEDVTPEEIRIRMGKLMKEQAG